MERMFDKDSFLDEITSEAEAKSAYDYFTSNLHNFRSELASEGLNHEEVEKEVRQCWENLIKSSQRVGFANGHIVRMAKLYKIKK